MANPIPWVFIMLIWSTTHANNDHEAANACIVAADRVLRSSDWSLIHTSDFTVGHEGIAIQLGVPERGESTKTGARQG
eukprot:12278424-Heterocapsa_arctica.AAC.1